MNPRDITITKVGDTDLLLLQDISRRTFFDTYGAVNTPENMKQYLEVNFGQEQLKSELADGSSEFYFALAKGKVVGYIKLNRDKAQTVAGHPGTLEIERIYVLKELQGKSIGRLLFEKALDRARECECRYLWLGVWEHNPKAIAFYERQGFRTFGTHIFVLGEDEQTDHLMKLDL